MIMTKKGNIVKRTKSSLTLLVIVLLAVSWVLAFSSMFVDREMIAQKALIKEADGYLEDKLYIRAAQNYLEALSEYKTEDNPVLEKRLVGIYQEAGMTEEYYELMESRVEAGTAEETEYMALADWYIENESIRNAISVLKSGIEKYGNDEMIHRREEIIYECGIREVNLPELKQPEENWIIPAFDGEKWGYVSDSGNVLLDFIYDDATPFCNGYAVVKLDGIYTLIDEAGYWNAVDKNGLDSVTDISASAIVGMKDGKARIYSRTFQELSKEAFDAVYMNDNGLYVVCKEGKWAILDEDLKPVTDYLYKDVAVNSRGQVFYGNYAIVKDEAGYFLIDETGKAQYETRFAGAKGLEGGLYAVMNENDQWGFADENAELVIDYQYVDAYSFSCKLAAVEYAGEWGYVNQYNDMIIEPQFAAGYPFVEGTAMTENGQGSFEILTLKYFEEFD